MARGTDGDPGGRVDGAFTWNDRRLVYETYGAGDRLVVLLHGLLMDARLNRGVARALAERGHRVVLLDLLGHGRSDKPRHAADYRIDTYAEQVGGLLDHLGAEEAVVGGVSLGANVSLHLAARRPERVRGLLIEMPVLERAVPAAALTFVPLLLAVHYAMPLVRAVSWVAGRVRRTGSPLVDSVLAPLASPPEVTAAVLHGILVGPTVPTVDERRRIGVPALVLGHRADLIHPFSDADALARQIPHARLVEADSVIELRWRPERLLVEIDRFLTEVWGVGRATLAVAGG
jgi:pimeloyl-ACP methyl ester carboxylesterase